MSMHIDLESVEHWKEKGLDVSDLVNHGAVVPHELLDRLLILARNHSKYKVSQWRKLAASFQERDDRDAVLAAEQAEAWERAQEVIEELIDETA